MRSQHYSDIGKVVEKMKKAMPARSLPVGATKRFTPKSTHVGGRNNAAFNQLDPPHEQFLKDLSYSKSIFEQTSNFESNMRHYFTT